MIPKFLTFILKLFLVDADALLLNRNKVHPDNPTENGFIFRFADIDSALADL